MQELVSDFPELLESARAVDAWSEAVLTDTKLAISRVDSSRGFGRARFGDCPMKNGIEIIHECLHSHVRRYAIGFGSDRPRARSEQRCGKCRGQCASIESCPCKRRSRGGMPARTRWRWLEMVMDFRSPRVGGLIPRDGHVRFGRINCDHTLKIAPWNRRHGPDPIAREPALL